MRTTLTVLPAALLALAAHPAAQKAALAPSPLCLDPHHPGDQILNGAFGVEMADFDGDGRVDLACEGTPGLQIWKRVQGGSLQLHQTVPDFAFGELTSGDMNGDGLLDLVATGPVGIPGVYVYLNSSTGHFKDPTAFGTVPSFSNLRLADLDGDGDLDVVAGDELGPDVELLLNAGDGTLTVAGSVPTGALLALGDLDGDGDQDMLGGTYSPGQIRLFQNDGAGAFTLVMDIPISAPGPLVLADLDADGDGDIATKSTTGVLVLLQTGPLVFDPPVDYSSLGEQNRLQAVDVDGDGAPDLAFFDSGKVGVLRNIGAGMFVDAGSWNAGRPLFELSFADQDGDGDLDLAASCEGAALTLLENEGGIDFEQAIDLVTPESLAEVDTGDIDGDGLKDIATTSFATGSVRFFKQGPGGSFTESTLALGAYRLQLGDMDGDHDQDLLFLQGMEVWLARNQGSLAFASPERVVPGSFINFALADLENDGDQDIVATSTFALPGEFPNATLATNLGNGTFSYDTHHSYPGQEIAVGELNGDGRADLVMSASNTVGILFSRGPVGYAPLSTPIAEPGGNVLKIAIAHLNDDRLADIAMALSTNQIAVSYNRGNGRFSPTYFVGGSGTAPSLLQGADFDNDRRMDLIVAGNSQTRLGLFRNRARFDIVQERSIATGVPPRDCEATDMNGDGLLDYVVIGGNLLSVILSECP